MVIPTVWRVCAKGVSLFKQRGECSSTPLFGFACVAGNIRTCDFIGRLGVVFNLVSFPGYFYNDLISQSSIGWDTGQKEVLSLCPGSIFVTEKNVSGFKFCVRSHFFSDRIHFYDRTHFLSSLPKTQVSFLCPVTKRMCPGSFFVSGHKRIVSELIFDPRIHSFVSGEYLPMSMLGVVDSNTTNERGLAS